MTILCINLNILNLNIDKNDLIIKLNFVHFNSIDSAIQKQGRNNLANYMQ